jgi:hypothetical protein
MASLLDSLSAEQRAAIARDYADRAVTMPELLRRHGLYHAAFYRLLRQEGWKFREPTRSVGLKQAYAARAALRREGRAPQRVGRRHPDLVLLQRQRSAVANLVAMIEKDIAELRAEPQVGLDLEGRERRGRLQASLTRSLRETRKLAAEASAEMERFLAAQATKADQQDEPRTLDEVRREFARRLQELYGTGSSSRVPE